ncbi:MAG TPA: glycosyltransferase family 39 protein [Labilithrix sp.]
MSEGDARPRWLIALRALPLVLGALHVGFFMYVVVQRFVVPVELEWMSGGVWDHVERIQQGKPLYAPPSAEFIAYLYPPLHYWLSALVAHAMPIPQACRVVSVVATLVTAACVFRATKTLGATRYWALVATALYVGAYSITGSWYDLDRSDSLLTAMLGAAFVVALESEGALGAAIAGALLGGAFLAKQPATVFFGAAFVALVLARRFKQAGALLAGGLCVLVPAVAILSAKTDGWFWFYCVKMPASHGIDKSLVTVFFVLDASKMFAVFGAACAIVARFGAQLLRAREVALDKRDALFGAMVAASFFTSMTSRLHAGGFVNVLMFLTTFGAIALAVGCARLLAAKPNARALEAVLYGVVALQLVHYLYDPGEAAPTSSRARDAQIVADRIHALEQRGEVVVPGRGHLTEPRHFHAMALLDVLRAGAPVPADLRAGLEARRYEAYVVDEMGELGFEAVLGHRSELFELVTRNYFVAQRLDDREPPPVVGWIAHPSWIFRARKTPLTTMTPEQLDRRLKIEMGLAEMRMRTVQAGARKVDDGDDLESLAAAADSASASAAPNRPDPAITSP